MAGNKKILIDSDLGDDIDDAIALAYALKHPDCQLLGVTTVFRQTDERASLARVFLDTYGFDHVPVAAGVQSSLIGKRISPVLPLADSENRPLCYSVPPCPDKRWETDATGLIHQVVTAHPHEVTIVAIGALTNIAMALLLHPQLRALIKEIVFMGGAYFMNCAEWNIACDPEAANVVFNSGIPLKAVGLDVTLSSRLNIEQTGRLLNAKGDEKSFLADLIRMWQKNAGADLPYLHDAIAVDVALGGSFVQLEPIHSQIELQGNYARGTTVNITQALWFMENDRPKPNISVGKTIDGQAFTQHVLSSLT